MGMWCCLRLHGHFLLLSRRGGEGEGVMVPVTTHPCGESRECPSMQYSKNHLHDICVINIFASVFEDCWVMLSDVRTLKQIIKKRGKMELLSFREENPNLCTLRCTLLFTRKSYCKDG